MNSKIIPISKSHVGAVADIHCQELPASILSRLGYTFLREFYYQGLVESQYFKGFVILHDGEVAGFIAISLEPGRIFKDLYVRHFFKLSRILLVSILRDYRVIKQIFFAAGFLLQQDKVEPSAREILSFAILKKYRSLEFCRSTGLRLTNELFQYALNDQKETHAKKIFLTVETNNPYARIFYKNMGFTETLPQNHFGLTSVRCEKMLS
jgi:ribosomal protein S18 acetylase RimI-like enzyme